MSTHFTITSSADAQALAKWDWVVVDGQDADGDLVLLADAAPTNPKIKVSAYIDGTENNGASPAVRARGLASPRTSTTTRTSPRRGVDRPVVPEELRRHVSEPAGSDGPEMINPTAFVPTNGAGERWNTHLADVDRPLLSGRTGSDGVMLDMVNDTSLWNVGAAVLGSDREGRVKLDLDRNGVRDTV